VDEYVGEIMGNEKDLGSEVFSLFRVTIF